MDTVAVTGGTGSIGRPTVETLADDHRVVSITRSGGEMDAAAACYRADCTDAGDCFGALAAIDPDAIVHLGTLAHPLEDPPHRVFESNAVGAYHVLEAAAALDIDRVVLASSVSAIGGAFEPDPVRVDTLPVDESHRLTPTNPYGLGKQAAEVVAAGIGRHAGAPDAVSLRFPMVVSDADVRDHFGGDRTLSAVRESDRFHDDRNTLFAYLHIEDAVSVIRAALDAAIDGHAAVWTVAADTSLETPTDRVAREVYPDAERTKSFDGTETLFDISRAAALLGWEPRVSWRDRV
ncbi:NAD-dependent epimerase/dehydratase family protein [Halococcoides cellulosivorans]|uniref:NAD(P)-dependent oxidoreductase n=1 Tax=Halococcoides cellulosivorans TaxID=1679096 RepID=A0A2R4WYF0_9EURY|nr:NAD(P)-dependent oxidoreductase [Halococcoides cellulosivorans]AWB26565.1 NAD(P)-dependent oxidoreductase [Halococcoides cellulosivorans]